MFSLSANYLIYSKCVLTNDAYSIPRKFMEKIPKYMEKRPEFLVEEKYHY